MRRLESFPHTKKKGRIYSYYSTIKTGEESKSIYFCGNLRDFILVRAIEGKLCFGQGEKDTAVFHLGEAINTHHILKNCFFFSFFLFR